jgi:hypothetical protein
MVLGIPELLINEEVSQVSRYNLYTEIRNSNEEFYIKQPVCNYIQHILQSGRSGDILESSTVLLKLFKGPYSVKNIALGMIEAIQAMAISRTRTSSGDKAIEVLSRAREELSKLD